MKPQIRGLDEFRRLLEARGFSVAVGGIVQRDNECNWYAYRRSELPARECECNDGKPMQIVVRPFKYTHPTQPGGFESAEVDVCGEVGGVWFKLMAYSLTLDDLREKLPEIEERLISAWNALKPNVGDERRR